MLPSVLASYKLRFLLAGVRAKQQLGLALSPEEENLVAECSYRYHMNPTEHVSVDSDGSIVVRKTTDVEPLLDALKDYGDVLSPNHSGVAGARYVGSIDTITAAAWSKECNAKVGTREFAIYAIKKINSSDFRRFRVGGGY